MPPAGSSRGAGAAAASDRRQSARQGRTSVTRPTNYYARTFTSRLSAMDQTPPSSAPTPGFCPVLTHFSQAVDAFPKELIRNFSMLPEVEAKLHDPQRDLELLLDQIAQLPVPTIAERRAADQHKKSGENSATGSVMGSMMHDAPSRHQLLSVELFSANNESLSPAEKAELKKRQLFFRLREVMANMLPALDEKLVVLNSATKTKDKGLARMNHSYAELDNEISPEARYGSLTHWAYADKEEKKKGGTERSRREVASANNLAAAAQHVHEADSIAAKSEARREAVLAKRSRNQQVDSDFDDKPVKKTQKRKAIATDAATNGAVGLGITSNPAAPQSKRKKTEKALAAATAAPAMERSLSGALLASTTGRGVTSPRATPGAETTAKRKQRAAPVPAQRKRAAPAYSPPPASSPLASTFAISKATGNTTDRPSSSRARKNSIANSVTSAVPDPSTGPRPSSSHSIPQIPPSNVITELEQAAGMARDTNSIKDASTPKEVVDHPAPLESSNLKTEEQEAMAVEDMEIDAPTSVPITTTRGGRASKTATPLVGTFPEIPMARSRSTRTANNGNGNSQTSSENNSTTTGSISKRGSQKKNAQSTAAAALPAGSSKAGKDAVKSGTSSKASSVAPDPEYSDGGEDGDDEPRYCYCNEVSYGSMVACDNEDCPREWFHLACVNMDKAPNARTKWYCSEECKEAAARASGKAKGGRPGSSRQ
ncbi:uncharacterized protein EI97DRAFT_437707 [Westerdykella ornata]|uniref:Chromatin modification-related protein n=1 Tax=Westerdykella ornata TaxID=318751 RepID=A0A6A6J5U8_WESOR|nr:uncharacterized protein EI97DRAFT_437707 [Westerdykella ornata]KAF2271594.1 hypothetical protein EI97DRAFT_437707 [Westerdykella ornata]